MGSFPRAIKPSAVSPFSFPDPLISASHSGKLQIRSTLQGGRQWTEIIKPFRAQSTDGRALLTYIQQAWANGTMFDIEHYLYNVQLGGATGTITVNGANQVGSSINLTGAGGSTPTFRAGELIRLPGISQVFEVTADCNRSSAAVTVPIFPSIYAGASPTNGGAVNYGSGVRLNARLIARPQIPQAKSDEFIVGLTLTFGEAV